ncbi:transcription repressor OFP6-like [Actinidia eriantha]|uniref:transcription repressor OFP6-like n=1 Tax=Actinidia eriantha TaxID=165200 RepID=UPI00258BA21E|nr:transcription repressor OFP6-like [Actinidia eriantha]
MQTESGSTPKLITNQSISRFPTPLSPMSSNKKSLLRNIFMANTGCGCGKPRPSDVFNPKPKPKIPHDHDQNPSTHLAHYSSSSSWEKGGDDHSLTSTTFSLNIEDATPHCSKMLSPCPKISNSVAVVKESDDPYQDFRQSMLQMILETEIYSKDDLQELLNCFLQLNSPCHHEIIVQAFTEIWNGVVSTSRSPQE